jgi:serine/threonine protein phosphatase 1
MKRFVLGDPHGNHKALLQCFERSLFDYQKDRLIIVGDVVDGYPDVKECIEELLKVKDCILVLGNHDQWALNWMKYGATPELWTEQGGRNTIRSYGSLMKVPQSHIGFLERAPIFYEEDEMLFVHGGLKPMTYAKDNSENMLLWDRDLADIIARRYPTTKKLTPYKKVFIGHSTTMMWKKYEPIHNYEIWNLDTGAGWGGKLTIMDIDTEQYWQSDLAKALYPESHGRGD